MIISILKRKAQATTEMAIFGTLILVCLGAILSYGQRLNEDQALHMDAFRSALEKAAVDNGFVSYTVIKNKGLVNLNNGFLNPSPGSFSTGASVLWAKGAPTNHSYYRINDDERELLRLKQRDEDGDDDGDDDGLPCQDPDPGGGEDGEEDTRPCLPVEVWDVETMRTTGYSGSTDKTENAAAITNYQEATLTDTVTTRLKTRFDRDPDEDVEDYIDTPPVEVTQRLYVDENQKMRYSEEAFAQDTRVQKTKEWVTPW